MFFNVLLVKKRSIFVLDDLIKISTEGLFTYSKKDHANVIDVLYITKYWLTNKF